MAWETALDRLLVQQIHQAEAGSSRAKDVASAILDLTELQPDRPETAFHAGYARTLLGVDLPAPTSGDAACRRWYVFGQLRGHDRKGERNWVADLLQDPTALVDLLHDTRIASQCLPLVMRTLFWSGDLDLAVKAVQYLAADSSSDAATMLVDASLTDLLTRLENREDTEGQESTASILNKVIGLAEFTRLPNDVQARYHKARAERLLVSSDFDKALDAIATARTLVAANPRFSSELDAWTAMATLRVHGVEELEPVSERPGRDEALEALASVRRDPDNTVPHAWFVCGILDYETGEFDRAALCMDSAAEGMRRTAGRDLVLKDKAHFFQAAAILAANNTNECARALRLMETALDSVKPDLESFYPVHEALKQRDRKLALRFLDAVDVGRGTTPDQLLFVALEYQSLGEPTASAVAAERVLQVAVDLDQRIEAMRALLTARNMQGDRDAASAVFGDMRDLLLARGAFAELETLLRQEEFVGQALDHLEIKCELVALYEEMEDREYEKAVLQQQIARALRARKDVDSLKQSHAVLQDLSITFPELAAEDVAAVEKLLALADTVPTVAGTGEHATALAMQSLGHQPRVLVVGGNERQRRHHPRFDTLCESWGLTGEWLMANYTSPQKLVSAIADRLDKVDLVVLLHWNRHETTEPALELARKAGVPARTVHYAGFTSLQVCLTDMLDKLATVPS